MKLRNTTNCDKCCKGKRISELDEKVDIQGTEYIPYLEGDDNGKFSLGSLKDYLIKLIEEYLINNGIIREDWVQSEPAYKLLATLPELIADRACKDEFGNNINDTYLTREAVKEYIGSIYEDLFVNNPPQILDGFITVDMLSDAVLQLLNSGGAITNFPDDEDITVKDGKLKFKDKVYDPNNYSGMGRTILRKNMVDGVNVLTQEMMSEPNVIYVIQYDYDLRGETIVVPDNSILWYLGGSLNNGHITSYDEDRLIIWGNLNGDIEIDIDVSLVGAPADEEDITTESGVLKFKDKEYDTASFSGLGRKYLRKNIVNGKNILTQEMINSANTRYIIQYDYDLNGQTITIPEGCTLDFQGGSFTNGEIIGTNTRIREVLYKIFDLSVNISGTWDISEIYPEWFGAIADNKTDSREAIQKSLDFANQNNGSTIKFSSNNKYVLNSLSDNDNKFALVLNEYKSINIEGVSKPSTEFTIVCNIECEAVLVLKGDCRYFSLSNISIDGNYKCNYVILCKDSYSPYLNWDNVALYCSNNIVCKLATYVSTLNSCSFTYGKIGLSIDASEFGSGPNTSTTLTSCYANWCDENGYYIRFATYCSMVSCACDHAKIAYKILNPYGFSMVGCGTENCRKLIECSAARGFSLDTFYALKCGGEDENNITEYLIEFNSAVWTKINGFYPNNCSNFKYKLGLTGRGYGSENISILDDSISREESYQLSNNTYTYPIKFFRNDFPNRTYTVTNQEELDSLIEKLKFSELTAINQYRAYTYEETYNTKHIISLSPGTYKIASLSFISGGDIVIKSSTNNSEDVIIHNDESFSTTIMIWQANRITFDSVTFTSLSSSNYVALIGLVSSFVTFNNCVFSSSGSNKGLIAMARLNSTIVFKSNCSYSGNFHQIDPIDSIVGHDDSSKIVLDRVSSIEDVTSNFRYPGCKIYFDNPINSGIIGIRYGATKTGGFGTATVMTDSDIVGSTDELNNIAIKHRGLSAYNTTFNKPVWWTGAKWVDATGAEV